MLYVTDVSLVNTLSGPEQSRIVVSTQLTEVELKWYLVFNHSFPLQEPKNCSRLSGCSRPLGNISALNLTQPNHITTCLELSFHQPPLHTTPCFCWPALACPACQESAVGYELCQLYLMGELQIVNEFLRFPSHFHKYKQITTLNKIK